MLGAQPGLLPAEAIDGILTQVRALDMDDVCRQIEAAQPPPVEEPRIITP